MLLVIKHRCKSIFQWEIRTFLLFHSIKFNCTNYCNSIDRRNNWYYSFRTIILSQKCLVNNVSNHMLFHWYNAIRHILENLLPEYHGILAKLLSVHFVFSVLLIGIPSITCVLIRWVDITISASLTDYKKYPYF